MSIISKIENVAPLENEEPTPIIIYDNCPYFETEVKGILYAPNCNSVLGRGFVKNFHSQKFFESVVVIAPIVIIMLSIYLSRRRNE